MKYLALLFLAAISVSTFAQTKVVGKYVYSTELVTMGQQEARQGAGQTFSVDRSFLIVQNKQYHLYKGSKPGASTSSNVQQQQQPLYFYILPFPQEDGRYCLFEGNVDEQDLIIYNAVLKKVYTEEEIGAVLNKCLLKN